MAAAVNCFETEPASVIDSVVRGTLCSISAIPQAFEKIIFPFLLIASSAPGLSGLYFENIFSILATVSCQLCEFAVIQIVKNKNNKLCFFISYNFGR